MNINPQIEDLIDEIKNDRTHGATELARLAVNAMKTAAQTSSAKTLAEYLAEENAVGERLLSIRPAMAPIYNMVKRLLNVIPTSKINNLNLLRSETIKEADKLIQNSSKAVVEISAYAAKLISSGDCIATHSYSSTVVAALKQAFNEYGNIKALVTKSGAWRIGEKTAQEIASFGMQVIFIEDAAIGVYISHANKVIVGADRICVDGSLVNAAGTYLLAMAAGRAKLPFYVLCDTLKIDPRIKGSEADLEEKDASESIMPGVLPWRVKVKNPYFDVTPPDLITGIITESGPMTMQDAIANMEKLTA